ncbi:hypothetical protein CDD82_294 [Ophiocordyceps australis]|uniref:DUF2241 domain-containing protein n=1 Tax=Ophiocordyceps australis TaxID=1399860 RepID=A0A2C5XDT7_9HYPO|nr:hypothetical protein CDD82_294 [Ophiocordyceps australis]
MEASASSRPRRTDIASSSYLESIGTPAVSSDARAAIVKAVRGRSNKTSNKISESAVPPKPSFFWSPGQAKAMAQVDSVVHDAVQDVEAITLANALNSHVSKRELENDDNELLLATGPYDTSTFALSSPKSTTYSGAKKLKKADSLDLPYFLPPSHSPTTPASSVEDDGKADEVNALRAETPTSTSTTLDMAVSPKLIVDVAISRILSTLTLKLNPTTFVFTCLSNSSCLPPISEMQLLFRETEGITLLVSLQFATTQNMRYFSPCRIIAVDVETSGQRTVPGLMATLASVLATRNLGLNSVSAFYHDHLLVPAGREDEALELLAQLASEKKQEMEALEDH